MSDKTTGYAQIWLSVLYTVGYFVIIVLFMFGFANVPERFGDTFTGLISALTIVQTLITTYWFQRQRQPGTPDPATTASTTTIQTRTVPTGAAPIAPAPIPPTKP